MNQVTKLFDNQELTVIQKEEEMFFKLNDVCSVLGLAPRVVKQRLEDDVCSTYPIIDSLGRTQQATFVNEDGLYDVILDSRKPEAKRFRKWITSEVLPSIRKTGGYQQPKSQAELIAMMAQHNLEQEQRITAVEDKLERTSELLALNPTEWRKKVNNLLNRIAQKHGGYNAYKQIRNESYQLLEERAHCQLSTRLTNKKRKMALEGAGKSKLDKVSKMDVIADDARLTEIYLAIVKELAIKYDVDFEKSAV